MNIHHMVVVDATRSSALDRWTAMLATFRSVGDDSTVSVLALDDGSLRTILAATAVRTAPESLALPALSGQGPHDVAHQLLRTVLYVQVQLDEPVVYLYMVTDPTLDDQRLKELRGAANVRIQRHPLVTDNYGPPRLSRFVRNAAVLVCVLAAAVLGYHSVFGAQSAAPPVQSTTTATTTPAPPGVAGPEAPTAINSGWNLATVPSVPPGRCVNQYAYASRLNAPLFAVVDCTSPTALMRLVQVIPIVDPSVNTCSRQSPEYPWYNGTNQYCFVAELRSGMCVPVQKDGDRFNAAFAVPASCRDPLALNGRLSSEQATDRQQLQIESVNPVATAPPCTNLTYLLEGVALKVCARLHS
ncbi:hypothetical protein SAMN05444374_11857 [Rhodococcoides kroppenstedtii]|uniref:Uncharacterized protein n=1 Tax=Rhodococcoides kroppenstedtii TaxID=293050 RepID=A0A1I0UC22_9NOCA|nr:hypothetical protein SAMN05444374_11857 [Rhodococcus kroppenstedtii]